MPFNLGGPELIILLVILLSLALSVALYFLPTYVAHKRAKRNFSSIFLVNFFFGWTLLGWVGCLAWALTVDSPPAFAPAAQTA